MTKAADLTALDAARILHAAGGALFAQGLLHAQLAGIEWEEEKNRLLKMLAIAVFGVACLLCTLLFAGGLVLAATWETAYRLPALAALVILSGAGAAVAWRRFQDCAALSRKSFMASRQELAADMALLKAST